MCCPANLLISKRGEVKLGDFGILREMVETKERKNFGEEGAGHDEGKIQADEQDNRPCHREIYAGRPATASLPPPPSSSKGHPVLNAPEAAAISDNSSHSRSCDTDPAIYSR